MAKDPECIFCKIVAGEIPATILGENERAIAFRDISPRKPVHILVAPREHHQNVVELAESSEAELHAVISLANEMAHEFSNGSFRLTFNTGAEAGQTVFHAHAHVTAETAKA
jgi:histidine triad (HIT) family protein